MAQDCLEIKTRLSGMVLKKFYKIKEVKGLEANAEVVRQLIVEEFRRLNMLEASS